MKQTASRSISFEQLDPAWQRYAVAALAVGAAWLLRALVLTEAADRSPFLAFGLAVLVAALGGFGPGLFAMALSSAVAVFFYLPPELALTIHDPLDGLQLGFFMLEGVLAATAGGFIRRATVVRAHPSKPDRMAHLLDRADSYPRPPSGARGAAGRAVDRSRARDRRPAGPWLLERRDRGVAIPLDEHGQDPSEAPVREARRQDQDRGRGQVHRAAAARGATRPGRVDRPAVVV